MRVFIAACQIGTIRVNLPGRAFRDRDQLGIQPIRLKEARENNLTNTRG